MEFFILLSEKESFKSPYCILLHYLMSAHCSFIKGLPGDELDTFIQDFITAGKNDPFSTWLILPTERLVQYAKEVLTEKNVPYIPSRICTLEGFCGTFLEENRKTTRHLSKAESKILLSQILTENKDTLPLILSTGAPPARND